MRRKGYRRTKAERLAISRGRLGMKFTAEHRRNIGLAQIGRKPSAEARKRMSAAHRAHYRRHPMTQATKDKIAAALRGGKHSEERRRNQSKAHIGKRLPPHLKGKNHVNYRHGRAAAKARTRYGNEGLWRAQVYERDGYACRHCGKPGNKTYGNSGIGLDACHIKPWTLFPKLRFKLANGITLCRACHHKYDVENGTWAAVRVGKGTGRRERTVQQIL